MDTREAIANRIRQLCKERGITPNALSNISAVPQATVKSILNGESKNPFGGALFDCQGASVLFRIKRLLNQHGRFRLAFLLL